MPYFNTCFIFMFYRPGVRAEIALRLCRKGVAIPPQTRRLCGDKPKRAFKWLFCLILLAMSDAYTY